MVLLSYQGCNANEHGFWRRERHIGLTATVEQSVRIKLRSRGLFSRAWCIRPRQRNKKRILRIRREGRLSGHEDHLRIVFTLLQHGNSSGVPIELVSSDQLESSRTYCVRLWTSFTRPKVRGLKIGAISMDGRKLT